MTNPLNIIHIGFNNRIFAFFFLHAENGQLGGKNDSSSPRSTPTPPARAANDESLTIAAVGDIMLGSTSIDDTFLPPNDGADILKEVTPILSAATSLSAISKDRCLRAARRRNARPVRRAVSLSARRRVTGKLLKEAGFDVLSLANNHAADFGDEGRTSTRKTLDALGIKHAGSDKAGYAMTVVEAKGRKSPSSVSRTTIWCRTSTT
jgi:hypothetical protein